jgi:hypothetical protein
VTLPATPHPRLLRAYRETHYEARGVTIRIGRRSRALDALLRELRSKQAGLITAWNPASRRLPGGVNRRRQLRLREHLRRMRFIPAQGYLRQWHEDKLLVAADPRRLAVIARRFGQSAIVTLRAGQSARLLWNCH